MKSEHGCTYGQINRVYIDEIKCQLNKIIENTNHFSQRLPNWSIAVLVVLSNILTGVGVARFS